MSKIMFRSEVELGKFLGSIDIIQEAYGAISDTNLSYELHTSRCGTDVLAFKCSLDDYTSRFLEGEFNLVPSENVQGLEFISTKVNSLFFINGAAAELFQNLGDDLKELENKHIYTPLIITGSGLGGYLAILSTLRLHHAIDIEESNGSKKTKRPICVTFGSPLVGDEALQRAIDERPQWKSSFLNVVAKNDRVASFFSSDTPYKPFGTFLFCTDSGGHSAFDDVDSILQVLDAMKLQDAGNLQVNDYMNVLKTMRRKLMYRRASELGGFNSHLLREGIALQLKEVGVLDDISNQQIVEMEKKQMDMIRSKNKKSSYDPSKKLNEMKISLTFMEWYMKSRKEEGGYYDSYKNAKGKDEMEKKNVMVKHQRALNKYWEKVVEEKDKMPEKEGAKLRKRWLYGGTNYRRIVEPLDIADYYQKGNINYIKKYRQNHYKLLEKWSDEEKKESKSSEEKRNKAASLTEDSCFWAHVEEALILLKELVKGGSTEVEKELERFETYVMGEINNYAVSQDIFLEKSSFMDWWRKYKAQKGTAYDSEFAQYMNNKSYQSYK